jgi:hypothetical protein
MSGDYHSYRRHGRYRTELLFPLAMLAALIGVLLVACVSWVLSDEAPESYPPIYKEKPSRFERFIQGMKRALKNAADDDTPRPPGAFPEK